MGNLGSEDLREMRDPDPAVQLRDDLEKKPQRVGKTAAPTPDKLNPIQLKSTQLKAGGSW
jgi:hypothetical protein